MTHEEVEKVHIETSESGALSIPVKGLPKHLHADISVGQGRCQFHLRRDGDVFNYEQNPFCRTPEDALRALKALLNWSSVSR